MKHTISYIMLGAIYTTSIVAQDKVVTDQLAALEKVATEFQLAIDNLVLKPEEIRVVTYISTPVIDTKYSAALRWGSPFSVTIDAQKMIPKIAAAKLTADQKKQFKDILDNIDISLTNLVMLADNSYMAKLFTNTLINRAEFIKQKNAAFNASKSYSYATSDYATVGAPTLIAYPALDSRYLEQLNTTTKGAQKRALNAITAQSMGDFFAKQVTSANQEIGILAKSTLQETIQAIANKATNKNSMPADLKIVQAEFAKLKDADKKALRDLLITTPANSLDTIVRDAQQKISAQ